MSTYVLCGMAGSLATLVTIGIALLLNRGGRKNDPFG